MYRYDFIKQNRIDILFLQETHCDYKNELKYLTEFKRNGIYKSFFNLGTSNSAGVAILLCNKIEYDPMSIYYGKKGRMMTLDVKIPNRGKVHLINIYGVANGTVREKVIFMKKLIHKLILTFQ